MPGQARAQAGDALLAEESPGTDVDAVTAAQTLPELSRHEGVEPEFAQRPALVDGGRGHAEQRRGVFEERIGTAVATRTGYGSGIAFGQWRRRGDGGSRGGR